MIGPRYWSTGISVRASETQDGRVRLSHPGIRDAS
jgi:hypothetical protein